MGWYITGDENMKKKLVGILVVALLIATAVLPVVGTMNFGNNQGIRKSFQPINLSITPRTSKLPLLLPPFLLELVNGDWDYWSNPPHMYSKPEGNVGIGTSNPTSELEVVGNVEADGFTINGNPIGTSTDSYWSEGEEGNIYYDGGDVGIGTSNPTSELEVVGNVEADGFTINGNPIGTSTDYWSEGEEGTIYYTSGNVGIGTDSPQGLLQVGEGSWHVDNNGKCGVNIANNLFHDLTVRGNTFICGNDSSLLFGTDCYTPDWGEWGIEYWDQYGGLNFWKPFGSSNWGNNYLFLKDDGDVGIGTPEPTTRLHVNGPVATAINAVAAGSNWANAYDITSDDSVILVNNDGWVKLPKADTCIGREYTIKKISSTGAVTVGCEDFDLIDGNAQYLLSDQFDYVVVVSGGDANSDNAGDWYIVGAGL